MVYASTTKLHRNSTVLFVVVGGLVVRMRCALTNSLLVLFAECERMMGGGQLSFAPIEFQKFLFQLLSGLFQFALVISMILLQFIEFRVQLINRWKRNFIVISIGIQIERRGNLPLFRFLWVQLLSLWHVIQTWLSYRLPSSAIRPNDWTVWLRTFVGMTPIASGRKWSDAFEIKINSTQNYRFVVAVDIGETHLF